MAAHPTPSVHLIKLNFGKLKINYMKLFKGESVVLSLSLLDEYELSSTASATTPSSVQRLI